MFKQRNVGSKMSDRSHIDIGIDREIIKRILLHICSDSKIENEFAQVLQESTDAKIRFIDFSSWITEFDENNIK